MGVKFLNFHFIKVMLNKGNKYGEKKFSKKHEWVLLDGDVATVGITKRTTEMLGDIVFVEVPKPGKAVEKEGQAAVESTKAATTFTPQYLEKLLGNKATDDPGSVNTDQKEQVGFKLKIRKVV